jgi:phage gp16-like protein
LQALARSRGIDTGMPKAKRRSFPGRPHNCDQHPQLLKIEALLTDARRPWSYVDAMADRMCGKARVAFCTPQDWQKLIVALELDKRRRSAKAT